MYCNFIKIFAFALSCILISGCEQDLNLDHNRNPEIEDILVVNSILNPDSIIAVSVTNPYFFSQPHLSFLPVAGLEVSVYGNEGDLETLDYDESSGLYKSLRKPHAGDVIQLNVSGVNHSASCRDTIPAKVKLEDVRITGEGPVHIYWDNDYRFTYKLTFTDPPGKENFYFLAIENDALSYEFSQMGQVDYSADYVFQTLANMINTDMKGWKPRGVFGYPFSDMGIDGRRYTLTVSEVIQTPLTWMIEKLPRKIHLYSISRAYFEYMLSVLSMDYEEYALKGNLLSLGLLEPSAIYSNIKGGAGIMGCYNLSTVRVDLLQLTGGWPTARN